MKKIIIVGGGVSGLSAGIYALQSGFDVEIYEKHHIAGGVCTSWSRGGYTFEGAVHWLTGSSTHSPLYRIWNETGILSDSVKMHRHDPYTVLEYQGQQLNLFRDIQKLKEHFLEISPQDEKAIIQLCKDIKSFKNMAMPIMDEKGVKVRKKSNISFIQLLKMLPAMGKMKKLSSLSATEYAQQFSHQGLRTLIENVIPSGYGAMSLLFVLATFANDGHFPEGGALGLVKRMTDKYISLGGKLLLSTKVDKVLVENGKAAGIIVNNKPILADALIVTQDILSAVQNLFVTPPTDQWIKDLQANTIPQLCTFIGIGIRGKLDAVPHQFYFEPKSPIIYAGVEQKFMGICNYSEYSTYAPKDCATLTSCFMGDTYDWWANAKAEGRYDAEKKALAKQIITALEHKFPQLAGTIEVVDVATPLTYERYTGSYKGSWMSTMPKDATMSMGGNPVICAHIENLYFAGFRTQTPGGLPVALNSGRKATQLICKQFNSVFQGKEGVI